ncbi:MAG TPA: T9SS type A sorting domain-containing protein [candidate division Zixibacteria bacterium]|nr:T9SS type A sorting domain-containing protein [candidate division Zixibacteria bacterium]MDD4917005.1 T9SS type A sorting domain-containing protein [candidate division Zixibacteria bacterium]MDM7972604.1 T9SS type A sorting domain-containing protein [candidate division Zixibacteria bacterium]HOD66162.1 T9SS type A sorting domain-containing protein [candidate division Zixibacteria bacterium]HPI31984.1 T9SS type A sorting domain-containing protein [candidate division Zixibacteria bacterium]
MKTFYHTVTAGCLISVSALCLLAAAAGAMAPPQPRPGAPVQIQQLSPHPATWDQITHNVGNIATTVDNWGYIGGYWYYGLPSGEWPRNSGRNYLGELMLWMGGITPTGDTLVANTEDDFQALPNPDFADNPYKILLSTDTARYYLYDPTDTVGAGEGNPARGWRVWDSEADQWDYNEVYNSLSASFRPGGPTSMQDSHLRFTDNAGGSSLMGLEVTQTIYQWNYCYNEDFLFVSYDITNASTTDYHDFAFGLYIDIDVGGPDGTGENGRLQDVVAFDQSENLAWIYDVVGVDPGWGPLVRTGIMGTKLLETPDNIGMTAFRTDDWAYLPDNDAGRYAMINSAQFDASLPPTDQFYVQCTRGIDLTAGKTVRVVFALVAGQDEADFRNNAELAQQLYDNNFVGPEPPATPELTGKAGSRKAYLSWSDTSEVGLDPMSGIADFVGYKLYRSDDRGQTWGVQIEDERQLFSNCLSKDYYPVAQYVVNAPGDPITRSFVDTGLVNGVEYWYCLVAFDRGDSVLGVDPLQNGWGIAGEVSNVIKVVPTASPAGYYTAQSTLLHTYSGAEQPSEGAVYADVFNAHARSGEQYAVVFVDSVDETYWHLVNETTGDTVLGYQTATDLEPGHFPIVEGLRVVVTNGPRTPRSTAQTAAGANGLNLVAGSFYGPAIPALTGDTNDVFSDAPFRNTYELRYTGDSTRATWMLDGFYGLDNVYWVPFECWNTSRSERVSLAVYDFESDGDWDPYDLLAVVDYPYDSLSSVTPQAFPYAYSWLIGFDETRYNPSEGDVFTMVGAPMNGPDDRFTFKVDDVNASSAAGALKNIKVAPNPFFVRNNYATAVGELQFKNIPDKCTIRIYTLAGDLVKTIEHADGTGEAYWNLLSGNAQQVASGIYLYHVESDYGEFLGRFAVIK